MLLWFIVLSAARYVYCQKSPEAEYYECGAHGRFEYCIDGIPGCVIGCHCHPGYYFDTDTKICEPNIKLTQNFRRQYDYPEPTRIHLPSPPVTLPLPEEPATTAVNAVDEKIDIITKDADDLGNWLYNQFFKTIENQLINETKDEGILTRRSASDPDDIIKKTSRRSNKYWRTRKKKRKKRKKHKMRSKLLRITEDDSLFDDDSDDSGTGSDEDSDSSSSSASEESDGDKNESKERKKNHGKDRKHKHGKEVVVYNKRPKPPLPSFIFLPNMETPFFPPIGLPPPAMPMYPMVPVPPVMGPPYPQVPEHHTHVSEDETKNKNEGIPNNEKKLPVTPKDSIEKIPDKPLDPPDSNNSNDKDSTITPEPENLTKSEDLQSSHEDQTQTGTDLPEIKDSENHDLDVDKLRIGSKSQGRSRNKFMQRMREKLKRKNKLHNFFATEYKDYPGTSGAQPPANCPTLTGLNQHKTLPKYDLREEISKLQDVDFKYLSQLIHKADLNKTNAFSPKPQDHLSGVAVNSPPVPSRRSYNYNNSDAVNQPPPNPYDVDQVLYNLNNIGHENPISPAHLTPNLAPPNFNNINRNPYRKKIEATNDTYYAHLGRQIATMIRNIDADKEVDIEIERSSKGEPIFKRIGQGSRSYWDRAVRSPYKATKAKNIYKKQIHRLKMSNEDLYSLENKVEMAASTKPTLGLHELENIVSKMERAKSSLIRIRPNKNNKSKSRTTPSKSSFNVNLLPGNENTYFTNAVKKMEPLIILPKYISFNTSVKKETIDGSPLLLEPQKSLVNSYFKEFDIPPKIDKLRNVTAAAKITSPRPNVALVNKTQIFRPLRHKTHNNNNHYTVLPQPFFPNIKFIKDTASKTHYHELNPMVLNRKSFNYNPGNNNQYVYEKASMPVRYPTMPTQNQRSDTSYFHHELHHFDYFDDLF